MGTSHVSRSDAIWTKYSPVNKRKIDHMSKDDLKNEATPNNLHELGEYIVAKETANRVTFQANTFSPVDNIYLNSSWLKAAKRDGKPIDMQRIKIYIEVL